MPVILISDYLSTSSFLPPMHLKKLITSLVLVCCVVTQMMMFFRMLELSPK